MFGKGIERSDLFSVEKVAEGVWLYSGSIEARILSKDRPKFEIIPMPPIFFPERKEYPVLVRFPSLLVAPGETGQFFIKFPIDIVVKFGGNILDVFSFYKTKFTLYGNVVTGVIAKYWESDLFFEEPKPERGTAVIPITIENKTAMALPVSNILISTRQLDLFYSNERVYGEKLLLYLRESRAEVVYTDRPPKQGLKVAFPKRRKSLKEYMEWGV